jgi:hypothetical protein
MTDVGIFYDFGLILRPFGIFYAHWVYFVCSLVYFFPILVWFAKKNLATLPPTPKELSSPTRSRRNLALLLCLLLNLFHPLFFPDRAQNRHFTYKKNRRATLRRCLRTTFNNLPALKNRAHLKNIIFAKAKQKPCK